VPASAASTVAVAGLKTGITFLNKKAGSKKRV